MSKKGPIMLAVTVFAALPLFGCGSGTSDDTVKIDASKPSQNTVTTTKATPPQGANQ